MPPGPDVARTDPPRRPRDYRPDLRPMLILVLLLLLVLAAWVIVSGIVLPPPVQ